MPEVPPCEVQRCGYLMCFRNGCRTYTQGHPYETFTDGKLKQKPLDPSEQDDDRWATFGIRMDTRGQPGDPGRTAVTFKTSGRLSQCVFKCGCMYGFVRKLRQTGDHQNTGEVYIRCGCPGMRVPFRCGPDGTTFPFCERTGGTHVSCGMNDHGSDEPYMLGDRVDLDPVRV